MADKLNFLVDNVERHRNFLKKSYIIFWGAVFLSFFVGNLSSISYLVIGGLGLFSTLKSGSKVENEKDDSFLLLHKDVFGVLCSVFFICFIIPFFLMKDDLNFFNIFFSLCFFCFFVLHCFFVYQTRK